MRNLLSFIAVMTFSTSALAFGGNVTVPELPNLTFPTESGWAKAMTEKACGIETAKSDYGTIDKTADGVVYTVLDKNDNVVAQAKAKNTFIWAKKSCL